MANATTERSVLLSLTSPNWFLAVGGGHAGTHATGRTPPAEIGQEKNILNWFVDVDAGCSFRRPRCLYAAYTNSITDKLRLSISWSV